MIAHAFGSHLEDLNGRKFIDGNGSWWSNPLGHRHPRLVKALHDQSARALHVASSLIANPETALLAEEVVAVAPRGLSRVHFSDDGSTAVEVAIKIAFQYWKQNGAKKRTRFISLGGAFHGDTLGAVSVGGVPTFKSAFNELTFEVFHASVEGSNGFERAIEAIESELRDRADDVAGVIVEPLIQGAAGMRMWSTVLLRRLRDATTRADTFLIADEVFTGYGRTGSMWACEQANVSPDLLCVAKCFSGGVLPMAATLATDRLYDGFRGGKDRALMHGHTFSGHPLGAAIAREVLSIYRDEKILEQVGQKAPRLARAFDAMRELPGVSNVRSLGMVAALEVGTDGYAGRRGWAVYEEALKLGAFLRPLGDTVYVTPHFNMPDDTLDELLAIVRESISRTAR